MKFIPPYPPGATPLDPDEAQGLIPSYIATQSELNEAEQANIRDARAWYFARVRTFKLTEKIVRDVHRRMFGKVWHWAGKYRRTGKNIGAPWEQIAMRVQQLSDDVQYWTQNKTYSPDEFATRLHHRLVDIHPFANGNGRHSRLITDLILEQGGHHMFSWGQNTYGADLDDSKTSELRNEYIRALQAADRGNFSPLLRFVRS